MEVKERTEIVKPYETLHNFLQFYNFKCLN